MLTPDVPAGVGRGWGLWLPLPPPTIRAGKKSKPKWISLNERTHWGARNGKTGYWRHKAYEAAAEAGLPKLSAAWVQGFFSFGDNRRRDCSNWYPTIKAAVDGLTDAEVWADDCDGIVTGPDPRRREQPGKAKGLLLCIWELVPKISRET